jgi:hypothetical protein
MIYLDVLFVTMALKQSWHRSSMPSLPFMAPHPDAAGAQTERANIE